MADFAAHRHDSLQGLGVVERRRYCWRKATVQVDPLLTLRPVWRCQPVRRHGPSYQG